MLRNSGEAYGANPSKVGGHYPPAGLPLIAGEQIRELINYIPDGKAKGADFWSEAELRFLTDAHLEGLAKVLNLSEKEGRWPKNMGGPIIALIPKKRAEHEGQMRRIALLPYVYRIWMSVRKKRC